MLDEADNNVIEHIEQLDTTSNEVLAAATDEDGLGEHALKSEVNNSYLPLRRVEISDKEYKRFVGQVERLVRSSSEYKDWVSYCRDSLGAANCAFTGESLDETGDIEIHHYPFTLYDIVKITIDNRMYNETPFSSFDIALEVIKLHFELKIGFIPLAGTLHKKYHKGFLTIPASYISGNFKGFVREYELDVEMKEKLNNALKVSDSADTYRLGWNDGGNGPDVHQGTIGHNIDNQLPNNSTINPPHISLEELENMDEHEMEQEEQDEIEAPAVDIAIDLSSMMDLNDTPEDNSDA